MSITGIDGDHLRLVEDVAIEQFTDAAMRLVPHFFGKNGLAYNDVPLDDADFVLFYMDLHGRGVTQVLEVIAPRWARLWRSRFDRVAPELLIGGAE